jgi:hypothetical protein
LLIPHPGSEQSDLSKGISDQWEPNQVRMSPDSPEHRVKNMKIRITHAFFAGVLQ